MTHLANFAALLAFILIIGPLPEKVGWRGYLLDHEQTRWGALSAGLTVGLTFEVDGKDKVRIFCE